MNNHQQNIHGCSSSIGNWPIAGQTGLRVLIVMNGNLPARYRAAPARRVSRLLLVPRAPSRGSLLNGYAHSAAPPHSARGDTLIPSTPRAASLAAPPTPSRE